MNPNEETTHEKLIRYSAYRDGWSEGAVNRPSKPKLGEWWMRGYTDGERARLVALNLERGRLGLPLFPLEKETRGRTE